MADAVTDEQAVIEEDGDAILEVDLKKKGPGFMDNLKKSYMNKLKGKKQIKIAAPKGSQDEQKSILEGVTTIPKIVEKHIQEIEIDTVIDGYSYIRIKYDNIANDYMYEVIEPKLTEEEEDILEVLKDTMVDSLEYLENATEEEKEEYLRKGADSLLSEIGVLLNPISKERVMYYILRDFMRYGAIDVTMIDVQVEDLSCDGM
ncbi:MAG: hypothetical protein KAR56_03545, partial [Thermoplasmata archaeon]|nr:hypothetical protein [Thermoplasmata archaeon]